MTEASFAEDLAAMDPPNNPDAAYHAHPAFNQSTANKLLSESPRHAFEYRRWQNINRGKPDPKHSRDREIGTVTHKLLLGSTTSYHEINGDDYKTKAMQEERSRCEREGVTPILSPDLARCRTAANAMTEQLREEFGIELDGESERVIIWNEGPLECKAKLDHVRADGLTILDVKTGDDANPKNIIRRILDAGYHVQAAAYVAALESTGAELDGRVRFIDLFIETSGLVMCTPIEIQGALLELGQRQWRRSCKRWHQCQSEGYYPGYTTSVIKLECPAYALQQEMGEE